VFQELDLLHVRSLVARALSGPLERANHSHSVIDL
jgi:hypothetical protein